MSRNLHYALVIIGKMFVSQHKPGLSFAQG